MSSNGNNNNNSNVNNNKPKIGVSSKTGTFILFICCWFTFSPFLKALGIRMILDSSMLTPKDRCVETTRYIEDLTKAVADGTGQELQKQFVECFPELVASVFGMPLPSPGNPNGSTAPTRGWIHHATSRDDFEALYQFLNAKGPFFSLLVQLGNSQMYKFPPSVLPQEAYEIVRAQSDQATSIAMPIGEGLPFQRMLNSHMNRDRQPGLTLNVLEFFLFAFIWFATQTEDSESSSIMRKISSSSSSPSDISKHKNMTNVLYSCLLRQYSVLLLELDCYNDYLAAHTSRRDFGSTNNAEDGLFRTLSNIICMFWLHQNPSKLFYAVSNSSSSTTMFVNRSRYISPTFLMLNGLHDFVALLLHHTAHDLTSVFSGGMFGGTPYYGGFSTPMASSASRTCGQVLHDSSDSLYKTLKLGLMLSPKFWPYLCSIWRMLITPWHMLPALNAWEELAKAHERVNELERRKGLESYANQPPIEEIKPEDQLFSTQVLTPYSKESLRSPFVIPKPTKKTSTSGGMVAMLSPGKISASQVVSYFGLSSIFGSDSPSFGIVSSAPSSSSSSSMTPVPENWSWYTFHDPSATLNTKISDEKEKAAFKDVVKSLDKRSCIMFNYPFYIALLRTWIACLYDNFIDQAQPLSYGLVVAYEEMLATFCEEDVLKILQDVEESLSQNVSHRYLDGRVEMEKRILMERWAQLERSTYPLTSVTFFGDEQMKQRILKLVKEARRFSQVYTVQSDLDSRLGYLDRHCQKLFSLSASEMESLKTSNEQKQTGDSSFFGLNLSSITSAGSSGHMSMDVSRGPLSEQDKTDLRLGKYRMDKGGIAYQGDVWDKPVSSYESYAVLWILYRVSIVFGFAQRKADGTTKTFLNLRPLGKKVMFLVLLLLVLLIAILRSMQGINFSVLFELDDDEEY